MLFITNKHTDAYFNLATEEYLLKNFSEDIFMLWQNEPSVIIGKHQNVWAEVNIPYTQQKNIKVARRFSGGGAVYHDLGNLNFTFIENGNKISENKYTMQLVKLLETMNIQALADERQALTINGLKISGSAQCIHKNRMMHHATLLFDTDLEKLNNSLQSDYKPEKEAAIAYVSSVKSPVTNIKGYTSYTIDEFKEQAYNYFLENSSNNYSYTLNRDDITAINNLRNEKYNTPSWNINISKR